MRQDPEAIAAAAAQTLSAEEADAFGATVGLRHTLRADVDLALSGTQAASSSEPPKGPEGPRTVDLHTLPPIVLGEVGAEVDADLTIGRVLGEGGMGIVQLATQHSLQREVALKRLRPASDSSNHAEALLREAAFTGFLEHPNIVPVHALGRDEAGKPVLVMKRIEGTTLATLLHDPTHPGWQRAESDRIGLLLRALRGVCDALSYAHARGVLHRDIKPENVMLGPFGEVYLLDWGVALRRGAQLTDDAIVGTPVYMAPEMLQPGSEPLDERTDVYLVGATLHECLVRKPPHQGRNMVEVLSSVMRSAPRSYPPGVPEELAEIARRAMHADRNQRFESAEALGRALADFERHRAAAELARAAIERSVELASAVARGEAPSVIEPLFYECRFGFEQSLRAWPENARARAELRSTLVTMTGYQLEQRNRASAAALLATIDEPPQSLVDKIAALDAELASELEERDRLRRLAHELDPSVAERERRIAVRAAAVLLVLFATALTAGNTLGIFSLSAGRILAVAAPAALLIALVGFRFRRELFRNRVNRQMGLTIACTGLAVLANRAIGFVHQRSFPDILSGDALLMATIAAISSLTLRRVYLVPAILLLVAAIVGPWFGAFAFVPTLGAAVISVFAVMRSPQRLRAPLLDEGSSPRSR